MKLLSWPCVNGSACSRPNDSRMVMALGEAYEKLERLQEAKKCFWKAHCIGDLEGQALCKLAKSVASLFSQCCRASSMNQQWILSFVDYMSV